MKKVIACTVGLLMVCMTAWFASAKMDVDDQNSGAYSLSVAQSNTDTEWTYQGCFSYFPSGTCYDVFTDPDNTYWICKRCGQTTFPTPRHCRVLSSQALDNGFWCS